jgi:hypothetical protein
VVGEGITGSLVIVPAECSGVGGVAVGAIPDAGLGCLLMPAPRLRRRTTAVKELG